MDYTKNEMPEFHQLFLKKLQTYLDTKINSGLIKHFLINKENIPFAITNNSEYYKLFLEIIRILFPRKSDNIYLESLLVNLKAEKILKEKEKINVVMDNSFINMCKLHDISFMHSIHFRNNIVF